ncbi:MAG: TonB family protein [Candidatus Acidiferrales bacterium]
MAPLTKDTLEIANPAAESAVSQSANQNKSAPGHMRSDAVSLEVSVRVHGSKVKSAAPGTTPHTEPFEEQTITMIIFPQGAVLKLLTPVNVGQMLVVTNLKSRQDAICRVIKVRPNANLAAYVEVEFTNRQPGYWGSAFPSDAPAPAAKIAPPAIDSPPAPAQPAKSAQDISWAPAAPPSMPASRSLETKPAINEVKPVAAPPIVTPPAKPAPSFIFIGSQEEVQVAASATATIKPGSARETAHENFAPLIPKTPAASEIPPPPPASLSMPELQGDADAGSSSSVAATDATAQHENEILVAAAQSSPTENSRSTFGSFAGGATLAAARSTSSESFGASFEPNEAASASYSAAPKQNWTLIAASAVLAIVIVGGGFFYFRGHSTNSSSNKGPVAPNPPAAAVSQSTQAARPIVPANEDPMAGASNSPVNSGAHVNAGSASVPALSATNTAKPLQASPNTAAPPQPLKSAKQAAPKVTPDMMSQSLSAHPTSSQRADAGSADAPALDDDSASAAAQPNALAGIPSSNNGANLPPPTIQQEGPVKIGGNVQEPRLVSSVMPAYPIGAMQAGISGDVVIDTTIDKDGKVVAMHVVSGSPLLRQAALDALRRWKYEPSTLDGQPVAVQMQVTIKFRR